MIELHLEEDCTCHYGQVYDYDADDSITCPQCNGTQTRLTNTGRAILTLVRKYEGKELPKESNDD